MSGQTPSGVRPCPDKWRRSALYGLPSIIEMKWSLDDSERRTVTAGVYSGSARCGSAAVPEISPTTSCCIFCKNVGTSSDEALDWDWQARRWSDRSRAPSIARSISGGLDIPFDLVREASIAVVTESRATRSLAAPAAHAVRGLGWWEPRSARLRNRSTTHDHHHEREQDQRGGH